MSVKYLVRTAAVFLFIPPGTTVAQSIENPGSAPAERPVPVSTMLHPRKPVADRANESDVLAAVLSRRVPIVNWEGKPLGEVIGWVRDQGQGGINVLPRWRALRDIGASPRSPVSLVMQNATVGEILIEAMGQVSDSLRYRGIGRTLQISTDEDLSRDMFIKRYELGHLVDYVRALDDPDALFGAPAGWGAAPPRALVEAVRRLDEAVCPEVRGLIVKLIKPQSWRAQGGPGLIECRGTEVIIMNSPEVHEMIGGPFHLEDAVPAPKAPPRPVPEREERRRTRLRGG